MKWFTVIILLFVVSLSYAHDEAAQNPSAQENASFLEGLLTSNMAETPYSAQVQVLAVKKVGNQMLYPTYLYQCRVLETYQGPSLEQVEYLKGIEETPASSPIGKTLIVSLFFNKQNNAYYAGDNGYELVATDQLVRVARRISKNIEKGLLICPGDSSSPIVKE